MAKAHVIVYSRPGCHLCDDVRRAIEASGCMELLELSEVSIANDLELLAKYQNDIPVVMINGVEAFRHRVDVQEFRKRVQETVESS